MVQYELWDSESANLVAWFDSETAALTMVREMMADHGPASIEAWGLIKNDLDAGSVELLDEGKSLADRAAQAVPS